MTKETTKFVILMVALAFFIVASVTRCEFTTEAAINHSNVSKIQLKQALKASNEKNNAELLKHMDSILDSRMKDTNTVTNTLN